MNLDPNGLDMILAEEELILENWIDFNASWNWAVYKHWKFEEALWEFLVGKPL